MLVTGVKKKIENQRQVSINSTCLQISYSMEICDNQLIFYHIDRLFLKTFSNIIGSK